MAFDWYEICATGDNTLNQGDFIPECPIVIPPLQLAEGDDDVEIEVQKIDSIILSQSCDLQHGKLNIVLVCPYNPLSVWLDDLPADQQSRKARTKAIDNLRKGNIPAYHLLNKSNNGMLADYQVVDFRNVYGINFQLLRKIVENMRSRIRLLPPYREHLSQAFARHFMRVGLPQDISVEGY